MEGHSIESSEEIIKWNNRGTHATTWPGYKTKGHLMEYRDGKKEITGHEQKTKGSFNGIH